MVATETKIAVNETNIKNLHAKMDGIEDSIEKFSKEQAEVSQKILNQVKYTNGRVTKIEMWQNYVTGFAAAIVAVLAMFGIKIF